MVVGIVGVLIPGLQPQLLGALAQEGRLSAAALGTVATGELLAMGIAAGIAGFVLPETRLRSVAALAILAAGLLDLLTPLAPSGLLLAVRAGAGLAEGVLIWIAIGLIIRMHSPARWSGVYLLLQTLAQLVLATLFGMVVIALAGSSGGFRALGAVTLAALAVVPWLPRAYPPLVGEAADQTNAGALPPPRGLVALAGVAVYLAFVVAVWVYVEPLGARHGIAGASLALVAPLSLAGQVVGAGAATALAGRVPAPAVVIGVAAANLVLLAAMGTSSSAQVFLVVTSLFGFFWLFIMPFQVPLVIAADPSRRAAALIGGAQLIGASFGPLGAATFVTDADVLPVLPFGAVCIAVSLSLLVATGIRRTAPIDAP